MWSLCRHQRGQVHSRPHAEGRYVPLYRSPQPHREFCDAGEEMEAAEAGVALVSRQRCANTYARVFATRSYVVRARCLCGARGGVRRHRHTAYIRVCRLDAVHHTLDCRHLQSISFGLQLSAVQCLMDCWYPQSMCSGLQAWTVVACSPSYNGLQISAVHLFMDCRHCIPCIHGLHACAVHSFTDCRRRWFKVCATSSRPTLTCATCTA